MLPPPCSSCSPAMSPPSSPPALLCQSTSHFNSERAKAKRSAVPELCGIAKAPDAAPEADASRPWLALFLRRRPKRDDLVAEEGKDNDVVDDNDEVGDSGGDSDGGEAEALCCAQVSRMASTHSRAD